ncbi:MAG: DUF1501 domain-containing protein [Planctomycetes bacterium]|nr:DUF1501 domain-containing protein [Planctomycetota bacterium]MCB9890851.1 DUF1501 domain-containing protein [Planctomycetota bacterium]
MNDTHGSTPRHLDRRAFLSGSLAGLSSFGMARWVRAIEGSRGKTHFAPRVRRIVWLMQTGGPSHVDLLDPKPELVKRVGEELPEEVRAGQRLTTMTASQKRFPLMPAWRPFRKWGESGIEISSLLPGIGSIADRLCVVRSMHTEAINHAPATTLLTTGHQLPGRPSGGAWVGYALGSANPDLPSYVVMTSRDRENSCGQLLYDHYWGSGFLPSTLQGVKFHGQGDPVPFLTDPLGSMLDDRRALLGDLAALNAHREAQLHDPEIGARTRQHELALRMRRSVPEALDLESESAFIRGMYGPDVARRGSFAQNCLIARRLLERGVRFVQLMHAGWDQHNNLKTQLEIQCRDVDRPSAALVLDLAQRGLLDDTLVVWGGEFGRTPFCQGDPNAARFGRDHHGNCFSMWLAGGGVRAGTVFGASDPFGYNPVDRYGNIIRPTKHAPHPDAVHVHDLQATVMHLLGFDHTRLTFRHQGRDFRWTDVHGHVVRELLG